MPASSEFSGNGDLRAALLCAPCHTHHELHEDCRCSLRERHGEHPHSAHMALLATEYARREEEERPARETHEREVAREFREAAERKEAEHVRELAPVLRTLERLGDKIGDKIAAAMPGKEAAAAPAAETPSGPLVVTWDEFMAETFPPVPSLWGDAFLVKGGSYTVLGGDTGVGKTIFTANLILALAEGRDSFLGFPLPGRPVRSLFLEAEGSRPKFRDWIRHIAESLGIKGSLPISFHARDAELLISNLPPMIEGQGIPPALEKIAEVMGAEIEKTGAEIVFLDPIGRFWSGNENSAAEWRAAITAPLAKLSTLRNVAFMFSDHYVKPNEFRSGQHKVRGSGAKIQDAGCAMRLEVGKAGKASRVLFFDRVRDGALPFPDRDPSRMPLLIDTAAGTIVLDERADAEGAGGYVEDSRVAGVRALVEKLGPTRVSTAQLRLAVMSGFDLEKSRATDLISTAKSAGAIESAGLGYYRVPGTLGPRAV